GRQRPQRQFGVAGGGAPQGQQPVITGGMDVARGVFGDGGEGARGLNKRVAFVVPERLRAEQVKAQQRRQQQHENGRGQRRAVQAARFGTTRPRRAIHGGPT